MSASRTIEFCGAFNGRVRLRKGETPEQALERAEKRMNATMPFIAGLQVVAGVDFEAWNFAKDETP